MAADATIDIVRATNRHSLARDFLVVCVAITIQSAEAKGETSSESLDTDRTIRRIGHELCVQP